MFTLLHDVIMVKLFGDATGIGFGYQCVFTVCAHMVGVLIVKKTDACNVSSTSRFTGPWSRLTLNPRML